MQLVKRKTTVKVHSLILPEQGKKENPQVLVQSVAVDWTQTGLLKQFVMVRGTSVVTKLMRAAKHLQCFCLSAALRA